MGTQVPRLNDLDSLLVIVPYMGETHVPSGTSASSYQMHGRGGEREISPHRTQQTTPLRPTQAGGDIIESRSHVHASIWVYPTAAEPSVGVPPCGGSHPTVTLMEGVAVG